AGETNPGSRLTAGKQVHRDVDVVFSQDLKESGDFTWIVAYRPRRNVELRFVSDDNNDRLYDFRHDLTFGAPARPEAAAAVAPGIAAARFVGVPGPIEVELHRRVSMTAGKTFDFFRWQEDRDRLEQFCRERGYLEGRVIARRSQVTGGSM